MEIKEAIKQSRFSDNYQKLIINVLYTANWLRDEQTIQLKQYDILPQHFNALRIIRGRHPKPISPGEIKEVLIDKANDLTRLLDKLEKKGLVKRCLCPTNRRKMEVTITSQGIGLLDQAGASVARFTQRIQKHLTDKEADKLSMLLDKVRE